ncbi:MAG: hypothetical protein A2Y03_08755 [Omnitrophica WOR_2 bacterium GWF2_38_59]|nr:MAG: hypothetical protein A2Y03_08755 [Omnitrophica WOR_2 bacterium GWF2_38_59]OGX46712.1 MAG: hypothetical protein A2243_02385 [Omnitrophica WOR_2 bacterium RIFOXYA2_FULL_38_17]OGX53205.1 MAG: hypothetical protein A2267_06435 [Omnitrophica WOR_2 bacterium RIFOXYA12_FULL_38_10]OGX56583.1 MAG: hypothetical protein A2447_07060 [Omnitrophica WOR_2 bacterium RIFOXYC2_FULL_38_12]OGX59802.1 MAG: hypothetical protein A2306_05910 [Omnitrophica WOR_2 bacterium RIFOXYB2_FULL_38_16]HBG62139.1 hypothet
MGFSNCRKRSLLRALFSALILFSLNGCIYLVVGGIGAVGGYIVSPDTVEGLTENDVVEVWDGTLEIISIMGTIKEQNENNGLLIAKISGSEVTIKIVKLNESNIKVSVKARKAYLPKISVAQDVFVKIMSHLNE